MAGRWSLAARRRRPMRCSGGQIRRPLSPDRRRLPSPPPAAAPVRGQASAAAPSFLPPPLCGAFLSPSPTRQPLHPAADLASHGGGVQRPAAMGGGWWAATRWAAMGRCARAAAAWRHERRWRRRGGTSGSSAFFLTECCLISSVSLADEIMSDKFVGPEIPMNLMAPHV